MGKMMKSTRVVNFQYLSILTLVVSSSISSPVFQVQIKSSTIPFVYLVFLFILFLKSLELIRDQTSSRRNYLTWKFYIAYFLLIPSLILDWQIFKLTFVFQIVTNLHLFIYIFNSCRMDIEFAKMIVRDSFKIFVLCWISEVLFFPTWNGRSEKTLGITHAILLTGEEGWVAIIFGIYALAFAFSKQKNLLLISLLIVLIQGNRSSYLIILLALLIYVGIRSKLVSAVSVLTALFTAVYGYYIIFKDPYNLLTRSDTTYTRVRDIRDALAYNESGISWFGLEKINIFSTDQNRFLPMTSNTLYFDLYWKFGVLGWFFLFYFLGLLNDFIRKSMSNSSSRNETLIFCLFTILFGAVAQFNNCFRMPWTWALLGAIIPLSQCSKRIELEKL